MGALKLQWHLPTLADLLYGRSQQWMLPNTPDSSHHKLLHPFHVIPCLLIIFQQLIQAPFFVLIISPISQYYFIFILYARFDILPTADEHKHQDTKIVNVHLWYDRSVPEPLKGHITFGSPYHSCSFFKSFANPKSEILVVYDMRHPKVYFSGLMSQCII